jgi:hypothetical protein
MVTQTPGENARSRAGRPDNKDRFVYLILHSTYKSSPREPSALANFCTLLPDVKADQTNNTLKQADSILYAWSCWEATSFF